jgi:UDP-N-acetylmuramoyl-L-alanyl-D-glutamate--2,6-diaminopimelate ligase
MLDKIFSFSRNYLIPRRIFGFFQPIYHYKLAIIGAILYRFPSRHIKVIGVTGTKGKSTTVEIISAILEEAGYTTALSSTVRFKIGQVSEDNMYKMSMPGRFFMQRFLRRALNKKCDYVILEMTSQGTLLYRHKYIDLDALVVTNISPEHIDAHGSYEAYVDAKVAIARDCVAKSHKKDRAIVANIDTAESAKFLAVQSERKTTYSLKDVEPYTIGKDNLVFTVSTHTVTSSLSGQFNLENITAAIAVAKSQGVDAETIARALSKFTGVRGRVERINAGQDFTVIVDYAHTPDSLEKLYQVFDTSRNICVLGGTGGGRDNWKRKEMGKIATVYCDDIILTNEDPYDEDPMKIIEDVASGVREAGMEPLVRLDRREAIREALKIAKTGDTVLITGKGTDPYIMGPKDTKIPWSDANVAKEELNNLSRV